jgi:hypothetical protein
VLIGHSQGAGLLERLMEDEIDDEPLLRDRLLAAYILGSTVHVPEGEVVGGDLDNIPLCEADDQTGCVVSYATFRASAPPEAGSFFGRSNDVGPAACVNPADLSGGPAPLHPYILVDGQPNGLLGGSLQPFADPARTAEIQTPWATYPDLLDGECLSDGQFTYLALTVNGDAADPRVDDIKGDIPGGWGLRHGRQHRHGRHRVPGCPPGRRLLGLTPGAAGDELDDLGDRRVVPVVGADRQDGEVERRPHLRGDCGHVGGGLRDVLVDRPVPERREHRWPAEQGVRLLPGGPPDRGVVTPGPNADAVRDPSDPLEVFGSIVPDDVLHHAAHAEPGHRLDQAEEGPGRVVSGRRRSRLVAPRAGREVETGAHVIPSQEGDPERARQLGPERRLPAARLAHHQDHGRLALPAAGH